MHNFNISEFLTFKAKLDNALCTAAAGAANRCSITPREAALLAELFCGEKITADTVSVRGLTSEAEALVSSKLASIGDDDVIKLTGRGEIAGKSIISAQEKFFEKIFGKITPEEAFIIKNIIEKIGKDI